MECFTDTTISLDTNTLLKISSSSPCIRELESFIDSQVDFVRKKKPVEENNLCICQHLFLIQNKHITCLEDTISHLRGELDCKQKVTYNLLDTKKILFTFTVNSQQGMTRNILFYKINHPILIGKMLIKVTLQYPLIKKQLISIKKPSSTIKNEIKKVSLFLTNTVIKNTQMTSLK